MSSPAVLTKWNEPVQRFFSAIQDTGNAVLVLNHDRLLPTRPFAGTSAQLRLIAQLRELHQESPTRLVLFTDRHWRKVAGCLGTGPAPEIWGVGGLERAMPGGRYEGPESTEEQNVALTNAYSVAAAAGLQFWIERKPGGVALRLDGFSAADVASLSTRIWRPWSRIASESRLTLIELAHGLELRIPGRTRQHAMQTVISETPSRTPVAYVGTDRLCEPAFRALGARGLRIAFGQQRSRATADAEFRAPIVFGQFLADCLELIKPAGRSHSLYVQH